MNLAGAGSSTITNTGGLVQATGSGSLVNLGGSGGTGTIIGGTLSSSGGGAIENNGSGALNRVSVSSGSTFTALNGSFTSLLGTTTFHDTAIAINSTGSVTDVQLSGGAAVELTSGSVFTMSDNFNNRIYGSGSDTLTNDAGSTIRAPGNSALAVAAMPSLWSMPGPSTPTRASPSRSILATEPPTQARSRPPRGHTPASGQLR